jgi:solute carrier family 15 oligopeptide transporter 1
LSIIDEEFRLLFAEIIHFLSFLISGFSMTGLLIIAIGTGGIKPCVSAFGGDQFVRPQQDRQLEAFFSVFYFAINAGSLISTAVTPILREDVQCFGDETCYPLAFGVPAILMIVAVGIVAIDRLL